MLKIQNINFLSSKTNKTGQINNNSVDGFANTKTDDTSNNKTDNSSAVRNSLIVGMDAIGILVYIGVTSKGKLGKKLHKLFNKGSKIPKNGSPNNNLPSSSSNNSGILTKLHIPNNEERLKVQSEAVKRLESDVRYIINSIEEKYVPDVKEYLYLYEQGLKKKNIFSRKRLGVKALQKLKEYDIINQNTSEITIKKKNDNKLLKCSYSGEYLNKIYVEDNGEINRTVYLLHNSNQQIVRVAENNSEGELDFIDFTFNTKEPRLATYTNQNSNKELTGLIYNENTDSYDVRYSTFTRTLQNGAIFPSIPGIFKFNRNQLTV